jgi:hypothetical protein
LAELRLKASLATPEAKWEGKRVQILLPFYKSTNPATLVALLAIVGKYGLEKVGVQAHFGDAFIVNARNTLADRFLETDAEWSLSIDDDIVPVFGKASLIKKFCHLNDKDYPEELMNQEVLSRLLSHNQKLVGGAYVGRNRNGKIMCAEGQLPQFHRQYFKPDSSQLVATDWVATGMMLVHRDVFLAIREKFPELAPGNREADDGYRYRVNHWGYYNADHGRGEDVMFCLRAKACGFQSYIDLGCRGFHVGYNAWGTHNTTKEFV